MSKCPLNVMEPCDSLCGWYDGMNETCCISTIAYCLKMMCNDNAVIVSPSTEDE